MMENELKEDSVKNETETGEVSSKEILKDTKSEEDSKKDKKTLEDSLDEKVSEKDALSEEGEVVGELEDIEREIEKDETVLDEQSKEPEESKLVVVEKKEPEENNLISFNLDTRLRTFGGNVSKTRLEDSFLDKKNFNPDSAGKERYDSERRGSDDFYGSNDSDDFYNEKSDRQNDIYSDTKKGVYDENSASRDFYQSGDKKKRKASSDDFYELSRKEMKERMNQDYQIRGRKNKKYD